MTYIVVSENEIVKAEMERLGRNIYDENGNLFWTWEDYLLSLPRIPAPGHKWKLWDEVVEGKDFKFNQKPRGLNNEGVWCDLSDAAIKTFHPDFQLIAIPIQPTPEGEKVDDKDFIIAELRERVRVLEAWSKYESWKEFNYHYDDYYYKFYKKDEKGNVIPFSPEYTEMDIRRIFMEQNNL